MKNEGISSPGKVYEKVNGCSHPLPIAMILAIFIMIVILILGLILLPTITSLNLPILTILTVFDYFFLLAILGDYIMLLLSDPADPRLTTPNPKESSQNLHFCKQCLSHVDKKSYHCKECRRCVEQFDHHCVFLNNCIGKQNYKFFFRLLLSLIMYTSINMGIGLWLVFYLQTSIRWLALTFSIVSFVVFIQITCLAGFHCYISLFLSKTTLQVIKNEKISQTIPTQQTQKSIQIRTFHVQHKNQSSKIELNRNLSGLISLKSEAPFKIEEMR